MKQPHLVISSLDLDRIEQLLGNHPQHLALQEELGRRVTINRKGMGGILMIAYSDEDDLIDLVDKLLDGD